MTNWSCDAEQRAGKLLVEHGLTIAMLGQLKDELLKGFEETDQVVLDLGGAGSIDIAGLQLLCSAHRLAVAHGKELLLTGIGDGPRELVRAAGLVRGTLCSSGGNIACFWTKMAR